MLGIKKSWAGYLEVHIAVLLFGIAGIFGKLVNQNAATITFGRVFFASLAILLVFLLFNIDFKLEKATDYFYLFAQGALLAFHWFSFFYSIQLSTVAIGLLSFSSFPIFVVFLEPLFFPSRPGATQLLQASLVVIGIYLILPEKDGASIDGVIWGIISGASFAFHSLFSKRFVQKYKGIVVAFYQNLAASIVLLPLALKSGFTLDQQSTALLVLLGVVFTALSHSLFIQGLKIVPASRASIIAMLEPFYGIIFAAWLISEVPGLNVLGGGMIIIVTAGWVTMKKNR